MSSNEMLHVLNSDLEDLQNIDLFVMASGYEPRCTHLAERLISTKTLSAEELSQKLLLISYEGGESEGCTKKSLDFFMSLNPKYTKQIHKDSGVDLRIEVQRILGNLSINQRRFRIVVDYTCMSRVLFISLLSLLDEYIEGFYCYSVGVYPYGGTDYPVSALGSVGPVPGLKTVPHPNRAKLNVFGLGYDGVGTLALVEKLEADQLIAFWADPGASKEAAELAMRVNSKLLERAVATFNVDLRDVQSAVRILTKISYEVRDTHQVVLVPVGPKPHKLACALVALQFDHVTLLAPYLAGGGIKKGFPEILAAGEILVTHIRKQPS